MTIIYLIDGPYDLTKHAIPDREPPRQYIMALYPRMSLRDSITRPSTIDIKHAVYTRGNRSPIDYNTWIYYYEGLEEEVLRRETAVLTQT